MKIKRRPAAALCLLAIFLSFAGCDSSPALYQVSTLQALVQGAYEGQVPCRELTSYGNLGIGTFADLDGELILLDGTVYQATADGRVICNPPVATPFADVVAFQPQTSRNIEDASSLEKLLEMLDEQIGSRNLLYAVRIDGDFREMKVRSVPRQAPPYPPLVEAVKEQRVFEMQNVHGTLVGFRFPQYFSGVNMPGWHVHFISDDRRAAGHVLELEGSRLHVRLQMIRRFQMKLPDSGTFVDADLGRDLSNEIRRIEQ